MDPFYSTGSLFLTIIGLTLLQQVCSQNFYVAAPNTFRVGEKETVVVCSHSGVQEVTVTLANCPNEDIFFTKTVYVAAYNPKIIEIKVNPEDIPNLSVTGPLFPHYVCLNVQRNGFSRKTKVSVSFQSGYIFIQTDKAIYYPTQPVYIRVIRLDEDMVADKTAFTLQIRNPQDTVVHSLSHNELENKKGMYSTVYNFSKYSLYGEWSISILYGPKVHLNHTVKFKLQKYVLPSFEIYVKVPEMILPDDDLVPTTLLAEYTYGRKVDGKATIKLKVKRQGRDTVQVKSCERVELIEGRANCTLKTAAIRENLEVGWFPSINGARLMVEAFVFERSSGYKENRTIVATVFAQSPHIINFKKSLTTYIAGLNTAITAQINYVNGIPAPTIEAVVTVHDQNNHLVTVDTPYGVTNDEGFVTFLVPTQVAHTYLKVAVKTTGQKHPSSGSLVIYPYKAIDSAYVGISRDTTLIRKVGESFSPSVHSYPALDIPMSYMVLSKGKILVAGSLLQIGRHQRRLNINITVDMVPSARVVLFANYRNELLIDSLKIQVEKVCNPKGEIKVEVSSETTMKPGNPVTVKITGEEGTVVGIWAVDKAIYALENNDRVTRNKVRFV